MRKNRKKYIAKQFSEDEYTSIRNEMIQRINTINSQASTAIVTILSAWAAALTLSLELIKNAEFSPNDLLLIIIIRAVIFLVPIFYFIPLAAKSGENITQIVSISAYIRVFYDYTSFKNNTKKMNWETSNNVMSAINVNRNNKESFLLKFCHETYTILAVCSLIFYMIFCVFSVAKLQTVFEGLIVYIFSSIAIILCIFATVAIIIIHNASCTEKNMMDKTKIYIELYIRRAYELGIYSEADVVEANRFLDANRYYMHCGTTL